MEKHQQQAIDSLQELVRSLWPDALIDIYGSSYTHLALPMPALRPLVLILKSHLVSKDLNCAFTGGISSYVLVILVVRFLQACELAYVASFSDAVEQPKWCYTFSRGGRVMWCTGIGSLLMLFLETYITFDYRRFGISIANQGDFFLLPAEKVTPIQCSVVIPYVVDPIKPGRSVCNCFRMHEVIQSWLALYQNLAAGVPIATCVGGKLAL
eukprot:jgi/Phyca11/528930/estExt2_fgenesh1_pm.C_PHYCAscaffold_350087